MVASFLFLLRSIHQQVGTKAKLSLIYLFSAIAVILILSTIISSLDSSNRVWPLCFYFILHFPTPDIQNDLRECKGDYCLISSIVLLNVENKILLFTLDFMT